MTLPMGRFRALERSRFGSPPRGGPHSEPDQPNAERLWLWLVGLGMSLLGVGLLERSWSGK